MGNSVLYASLVWFCLLSPRLNPVLGKGNEYSCSESSQDVYVNDTSRFCDIVSDVSNKCCTGSCVDNQKRCWINIHPMKLNVTNTATSVWNKMKIMQCCPESVTFPLSSMYALFKVAQNIFYSQRWNSSCPADIALSLTDEVCGELSDSITMYDTYLYIKGNETNNSSHFYVQKGHEYDVISRIFCRGYRVVETHNLSQFDENRFESMNKNLLQLEREYSKDRELFNCGFPYSVSPDLKFLKVCEEHPRMNTVKIITYCLITFSVASLAIIISLHLMFKAWRDTQGLCIVSLSIALVLSTVTGGLKFVPRLFPDMEESVVHGLLSVLFTYSWLSVCAWQMVMSFHVYRTFGKMVMNKMTRTQNKRDGLRYSLIGWCIPVPPVFIAVVLYHEDFTHEWFHVSLGSKKSLAIKLSSMSLMILVGLFFVISTFLRMKKFQKNSSRTGRGKARMRSVAFRLQLLLGIPWITSIVTSICHAHIHNHCSDSPNGDLLAQIVLTSFYMIKSLQGVFVFIAFVSTEKVRGTMLSWYHRSRCSDRRTHKRATRRQSRECDQGGAVSQDTLYLKATKSYTQTKGDKKVTRSMESSV